MTRTLQNQLIEKGLVNKIPKKQSSKQTRKKKQDKPKDNNLSRRELEELMGTNRPKYHKVKGSFRSR